MLRFDPELRLTKEGHPEMMLSRLPVLSMGWFYELDLYSVVAV